jgi:hypothetical protein
MPAEGIHLTALQETAFLAAMPTAARRCVLRFTGAARLGSVAPDLPYFDRYGEELVRYVAHVPARPSPWGRRIHDGGAVELLHSVLDEARKQRAEVLAALAMGLASHACVDRTLHPLVNALARRFPEAETHDASHREVEKFQSILFHEVYLGRDFMGTPALTRLIEVPSQELMRDAVVGSALAAAFQRAASDPAPQQPLRRMARGYWLHTLVLGSPLGRRVAPPSEKERSRPLFLEGGWGRFESALTEAIRLSAPVLEQVWAVFEASEADVSAARAQLDQLLPRGSIEGQGRELDLDSPFTPRPPSVVS